METHSPGGNITLIMSMIHRRQSVIDVNGGHTTVYLVAFSTTSLHDVRVDITLTWKHWYACIISLCFYTTIRSILLDGDPIVTVNHHPNDH